MTKHRITRRKSQKGGSWFDAINPFSSSEQTTYAPTGVEEPGLISNLSNSVSGATSGLVSGASNLVSGTESMLSLSVEKAKGAVSNSGSWFSNLNPFSSGEEVVETQTTSYNPQQQTYGGRRRSKTKRMRGTRQMKGGKGGLGLVYYATDVSNDRLMLAEPTYWIKGGSMRRRRGHKKHRKTHRKKH